MVAIGPLCAETVSFQMAIHDNGDRRSDGPGISRIAIPVIIMVIIGGVFLFGLRDLLSTISHYRPLRWRNSVTRVVSHLARSDNPNIT